ncbi:hypothetical protein VTK73DRAFT_4262 [Phialemonium thermophilum]|uniref:PHD-type domain-containing protein n=1 Tax=Phialemonium thermophilum TaxID=223376 RepID=A0ABR3WU95_9PEZI
MPLRQYSCNRCDEGPRIDKPLHACTSCNRLYHSACHRPPPPQDSNQWMCQKCTMADGGHRRRPYHDSASISSYSTSVSSPSLRLADSKPGLAYTSNSSDMDLAKVLCAYPKCTAEPMASSPLCAVHMADMAKRSPAPRSTISKATTSKTTTSTIAGSKHTSAFDTTFETTRARFSPERHANGVAASPRKSTGPASSTSVADGSSNSAKPTVSGTHLDSPQVRKASVQRASVQLSPRSPPRKKIRVNGTETTVNGERKLSDREKNGGDADRLKVSPQMTERPPRVDAAIPSSMSFLFTRRSSIVSKDTNKKLYRPQVIRKSATQTPPLGRDPLGSDSGVNSSSDANEKMSSKPLVNNLAEINGLSLNRQRSPSLETRKEGGIPGNQGLNAWWSSATLLQKGAQRVNKLSSEPNLSTSVRTSELPNGERGGKEGAQRVDGPATSTATKKQCEDSIRSEAKGRLVDSRSRQARSKTGVPPQQGISTSHKSSKMVEESTFDALIYSQESSSAPPPGIQVIKRDVPQLISSGDTPHYAHIDPRFHWPQERSERWYKQKQEEIAARGGRKTRFGKVVDSMKGQRLQAGITTFEDRLPERIRNDPAWVRGLKALEEAEPRRGGQPQARQAVRRH